MMKIFWAITIFLATLSLAIGYALAEFGTGTAFSVGIGLLWLVALWRKWWSLMDLCVIILIGLTALGTWPGVSTGWLLFSVVATLTAWDLGGFVHRFGQTEHRQGYTALQRIHLQRLAIVAGSGLLLGSLSLNFEVRLNLWWSILLGLLIIVGLSRVITVTRHQKD